MRHFISAPTLAVVVFTAALLASASAEAADQKKAPYYASISAGRARMRTGPSRTYPANWLYQRADLPVKVLVVLKEWRKIVDPDGTEGWMQGNLLSGTRTAIVRGTVPIELRERPDANSRLLWRAAPGVVGRLSQCANGWCRVEVRGQAGFAMISGLWGVDAAELLP